MAFIEALLGRIKCVAAVSERGELCVVLSCWVIKSGSLGGRGVSLCS